MIKRIYDKAFHKAYYQKRKLEKPGEQVEYNFQQKLNNPARVLLYNARGRSKKKNWNFDLDESDIIIPEVCPVFQTPMVVHRGKHPHNPSIDRIDNSKGYIKGNIRVISWRANDLMKDGTLQEFKDIVRFLDGS